jgi:hypothetical protein
VNLATRKPFDLNIEEVLEHWHAPEALRELIANALDEHALTQSREPEIEELTPGQWRIRDWGRGLRHEHFTQKEDPEKLAKPDLVIGKFGFGLKDAIGALDRRGVRVSFRSRYADIGVERLPKHGFEHIKTLHAVVSPPSQPDIAGTEVLLEGVTSEQMSKAKGLFLTFAGDQPLEQTKYGTVLKREGGPARIYVNGLRVAEEPNFLFGYNITSLTKGLRDALNRERSNVGRQAYSDRIKDILQTCTSEEVAGRLADDLALFERGRMHDENNWLDVSLHACRVLNARQKVIFVTPEDQRWHAGHIEHAIGDGYRIVVVPETIAYKLPKLKDLAGNPIRDLGQFVEEWNDSFTFDFVALDALSPRERAVFALTTAALALVKDQAKSVKEVLVSNTMRLSNIAQGEAAGLWDPPNARIIIKRTQLRSRERFLGTLLHEVGHAFTAAPDVDAEFEDGLTDLLGTTSAVALTTYSELDARSGSREIGSRRKRVKAKRRGDKAVSTPKRASSRRMERPHAS